MKQFVTRLLLVFLLTSVIRLLSAEMLTGEAAARLVKGSEAVLSGKFSSVPEFVRFKPQAFILYSDFDNWMIQHFQLPVGNGFKLLSQEKDNLGFVHYRLQQTIDGTPIEGTMYILHTKNGLIQSMNGLLLNNIYTPVPSSPTLSKAILLKSALQYIGAAQYKWQSAEAEKGLKETSGNPNATYFPVGELVYVGRDGKPGASQFYLAYKFDVYATEPLSRSYVFVDALTGNVILTKNRLNNDVAAIAHTQYSGVRTIATDNYSGSYRLRETGRGNGIRTYDAQHSISPSNDDFTNSTTIWNNVNANKDQYATDAHFASEMTYDFYFNNFGRNSLDGNGLQLIDYVHYDTNLDNAFWDGDAMNYGDGNATNGTTPYSTLDIGGHEITHGLTQYTANLDYVNESGALNESFSDCMGIAIRQYVKQLAIIDYLIGDDNGPAFRSLSNPKDHQQPTTYHGQYWYTGTQDDGGVHTNSGVQNYWFYLLAHGNSGMNDSGHVYNVTGITIEKAAAIAYRSLTVYLTPTSDYFDARTYSIIAAEDLYGGCSPEVRTVTNAWYAVAVGDTFSAHVDADFAPAITASCTVPVGVSFTNVSTNASAYFWDFGDSNYSTLENPSHTYNQYGSFNVRLTASSPVCGIDTVIKSQLITISNQAPTVFNQSVCRGESATLSAVANGNMNWYSTQTGGSNIGTGASFTTPALSAGTTYYAETEIAFPITSVGPADHNFGTGGNNSGTHYVVFNNTVQQVLLSVDVDANGAGNRTIQLRDVTNAVLATTTVNLVDGLQTVPLNFTLPVQNDLRLGTWSGASNLYRNTSGAIYPYNSTDNTVSITGNDADPQRFYFFYNWQIQPAPCYTGRTPVVVDVLMAGGSFTFAGVGNTLSFTPDVLNATSYTWDFNDGNSSTQQTPLHTFTEPGTYNVQLIESNSSCSDTIIRSVVIESTGFVELSSLSNITLMPNPAKDLLYLQMNSNQLEGGSLSFSNMLGETVLVQNLSLTPGRNSIPVEVASLPSGVYLVNIQAGDIRITKRFVKSE